MRLLLDTHVVIWAVTQPARLSVEARAALEEPRNEAFVSAISPWEIGIKHAKGQLAEPAELLAELRRQGFNELRVTWDHGVAAGRLPPHHADPFDRMLVAQAQVESLTIVTHDDQVAQYDVAVLRA